MACPTVVVPVDRAVLVVRVDLEAVAADVAGAEASVEAAVVVAALAAVVAAAAVVALVAAVAVGGAAVVGPAEKNTA